MLISEKEARAIAEPFGEAAARLTLALRKKISGELLDEMERQLDALIDGAPLMVSELDIPFIRVIAREHAGTILIAANAITREEGLFLLNEHDHLDRICKVVGGRVAA